jgi:hypothetical protein
MKKELRALMWVLKRRLKKHYKTTVEHVKSDMDSCGNPVIAKLWNTIQDDANKIEEKYQRDIATEFPMIILWMIYKDTAYSPIFFHCLKKVFELPDLYEQICRYSVEPEDWYVNTWHDTKKRTQELKDEGKIANLEGMQGGDERIFTPTYQEVEFRKLEKRHPNLLKKIEQDLVERKKKMKKG